MKKNHTQEAALHLRRIHFFILLSSIACLVLFFGYRNHSVQMGLDELKILTDELKPILQVKEKEPFSALSNKWDKLRADISFHKYWVLTSEEIMEVTKEHAKLPHPETQTVDISSLDSCKNWNKIDRTDSSEFSTQLQIKNFYPSKCSWLGENVLFSELLPLNSNLEVSLLASDVQTKFKYIDIRSSIELENLRAVSNANDLDDCGRWSEIDRVDYQEFTRQLSNLVSFYCYWNNEDALVVIDGNTKSGGFVLVTPGKIMSWNKVTIESFKRQANRVKNSEIEKCGSIHVDNSIEKIRSNFKKIDSNKGALFCYWINSNYLIVMETLWDKLPLSVRNNQNYRDRVGFSFDEAFPGLTSLRELQEFYPEEFYIKESDSIRNISSKLRKALLDIEATISGIIIKQEVLLFGGPPLLVLLQLYFLLHYVNFVILCDRTRRTIFPWIGMYKDAFSKFVFGISLCIVPPFAMFLFANERVAQNDLIAWTVFAASVIISLLQLYFIRRFWRKRDETVILPKNS